MLPGRARACRHQGSLEGPRGVFQLPCPCGEEQAWASLQGPQNCRPGCDAPKLSFTGWCLWTTVETLAVGPAPTALLALRAREGPARGGGGRRALPPSGLVQTAAPQPSAAPAPGGWVPCLRPDHPDRALSAAALTVLSCPRSATSPQTPRTATPSPRPATCWTSCCARTSARPRGRPCPEAGPPPPPTPWAPAPWAVTCPEVGQVRRRREHPSPGGAGAFQAAGFLVHQEDSHMRHLGVLDASRTPGTQLHERHRPHVLRALDPPMAQV